MHRYASRSTNAGEAPPAAEGRIGTLWNQLHAAATAASTAATMAAAAAALVAVIGLNSSSPALAVSDPAAVGKCVIAQCTAPLARCLTSPSCIANLACINSCSLTKSGVDEVNCQVGCGDLFEDKVVGEFNACAVSQKQCVPRRQDDGSYPVPPATALVTRFDTTNFEGRWYISAGLNQTFDTFDCQVHFFTSPKPGELYGQLNWRIQEPDGEFFTRDTIQRFIQKPGKPALLENHDNEYLHYQDDWYILDADAAAPEDKAFVLVYYRGSNDAWDGYGGAVLYTKSPTVPSSIRQRVQAACETAGLDFSRFKFVDNTCKVGAYNATLLREKYASKMLIVAEKNAENAIASEATSVRSAAASAVAGRGPALQSISKTLSNYERELRKDLKAVEKSVEKVEKTLSEDISLLENVVEKDIEAVLRVPRK